MVRRIINYSLALMIAGTMFSSCYYDVEDELYPVTGADTCATPDISYANGISQLVNTSCALPGCHASGSPQIDLSNFAGVKTIADNGKMHQRVIIEKSMPPGNPLPPCEMTKIKTWLDKGAPEF